MVREGGRAFGGIVGEEKRRGVANGSLHQAKSRVAELIGWRL